MVAIIILKIELSTMDRSQLLNGDCNSLVFNCKQGRDMGFLAALSTGGFLRCLVAGTTRFVLVYCIDLPLVRCHWFLSLEQQDQVDGATAGYFWLGKHLGPLVCL